MRNPNLKVGEVKEQGKDEITATIVTKDKDALVQKLVVNRHTGFFHPGRRSDVGLWTGFRLRHDGRRFGYGPGPIGMIIWVVILIAVVVAIVWLVRSLTGTGHHHMIRWGRWECAAPPASTCWRSATPRARSSARNIWRRRRI